MQNCVKCNKTRTDWCKSSGPPLVSKQLLNACPIPPMHIIVRLLPGHQSSILSTNELHNDMNPAFISAVISPNLKTKQITTGMRQSIPIPNQNIRRCPGLQRANPYTVGNSHLANMGHKLRIPQIGTPYATNGTDGHGVREMCHKQRRMGAMVEGFNLSAQHRRHSPSLQMYPSGGDGPFQK